MLCFRIFPIAQKFMEKRAGLIKIFCRNFFPHFAEKFRKGIILCFKKLLVLKNVRPKRRGGYHDFQCMFFLSRSTETFSGGIFLCFRKFGVSKIVMLKRGLSRSFTETFLCHSAEKSCREPLSVSLISCVEKFYA